MAFKGKVVVMTFEGNVIKENASDRNFCEEIDIKENVVVEGKAFNNVFDGTPSILEENDIDIIEENVLEKFLDANDFEIAFNKNPFKNKNVFENVLEDNLFNNVFCSVVNKVFNSIFNNTSTTWLTTTSSYIQKGVALANDRVHPEGTRTSATPSPG